MLRGKTVILITGPTAVGKTALAVEVALHFRTSIISADSRQCYREMNIGVARPPELLLHAIPHYFVASHSITEQVTAAVFERYALDAAARIFESQEVLVMVGGTGLYVDAFCEGLDEIPPIPDAVREAVRAGYRSGGLAWLQNEIRQKDPEWFRAGERTNPHRLQRALEVMEATGRSIREFQSRGAAHRPFRVIKVGLDLPRATLYDRINRRVLQMMEAGLLEEVVSLSPQRALQALQTVGYQELFSFLDERCSLEVAVAQIQQNTRNYAKRQLTWFRRDTDLRWFAPDASKDVLSYVDNKLLY